MSTAAAYVVYQWSAEGNVSAWLCYLTCLRFKILVYLSIYSFSSSGWQSTTSPFSLWADWNKFVCQVYVCQWEASEVRCHLLLKFGFYYTKGLLCHPSHSLDGLFSRMLVFWGVLLLFFFSPLWIYDVDTVSIEIFEFAIIRIYIRVVLCTYI